MPRRPRAERIELDVARLLPRMRKLCDGAEHEAQVIARIVAQATNVDEPLVADPRVAAGDPARLRGLPAIGPNVSGAMAGTDPVRALLAKESRRRRR
ncbi:MAG: hypothetical protein ABIR67_15130 [Gaiellaceae bacterium]